MKSTQSKALILSALTGLFFSLNAFAINPYNEESAACTTPNRVFLENSERRAEQVMQLIRCDQLKAALEQTQQLEASIKQEIIAGGGSSTERGYCYEAKNCKGGLVVRNIIPKDACEAALGASWKKVAPAEGTCQNL